ncbi:peptidoglycan L-alanyl-D-glutamate endopeptidase CwlK [Halobacillus alkaliphilus]|uniref:Peptidoglycan L-alanyl-D-glutamate endopeptidase CwlK n=1 Tax=Halobacillus alkaliphilus TaxID=396056 RepID=A0A1I2SWI5_9BACI|nr:M15 family metallopeptidase [Halobacillus alkaliphilus]SFG57010.1 peptidoglycan L-alanyl-D-glutamate endopeptidase CwlK [Halobacillus alkaliphilus]
MKILSKLTSFVVFIATLGLVVYVLIPEIEKQWPGSPFVKKDVPVPEELHPRVKEYKEELVALAAEQGIEIAITEGHRSVESQNELYARGRSKEGQVVTHAQGGESYHNYGLAIDFALKTNNGVVWDMERDGNGNGKSDWMEVVAIAKDLGFEWGGDWSNFKDYPHLQMDFGLTIRDLKYGKRPNVAEYADK